MPIRGRRRRWALTDLTGPADLSGGATGAGGAVSASPLAKESRMASTPTVTLIMAAVMMLARTP